MRHLPRYLLLLLLVSMLRPLLCFQTSSIRWSASTKWSVRRRRVTSVIPKKQPLCSLSSSYSSENDAFFASHCPDFASMGIQSPVLLQRLNSLRLMTPTAVQAAAFHLIRQGGGHDVIVGAETGSGKTLAYLLPLMDDILQRKTTTTLVAAADNNNPRRVDYDYARAIVLVPNKELVQQAVRMALPLAGGAPALVMGTAGETAGLMMKTTSTTTTTTKTTTDPEMDSSHQDIVRLAVLPGGLHDPMDFRPFRESVTGNEPPVDLIFCTPATLGSLGLKPKYIDLFADIETLVVDEADMLLDGGYIRDLENVLMGFRRADRLDSSLGVKKTQFIFCAATLPDMGLRSVDAYLQRKFPHATRVTMQGMHNARHYGLSERTVWIEEENKKSRMEQLVNMLQTPVPDGGLEGQKVMVFLNSVEDVDGACQALNRAGNKALAYHAKLSLDDRTGALDRFRRYSPSSASESDDTVPILVCTDLASRGLDVPGVNAVVQLQFAGNVVAHLHRMGRCGRAGQRTGRGIVFHGEKERDLVRLVQQAEEEQEQMVLEGDVLDLEDEEDAQSAGKVKPAFSRKRGFTKKLKKQRREETSSTTSD